MIRFPLSDPYYFNPIRISYPHPEEPHSLVSPFTIFVSSTYALFKDYSKLPYESKETI